MSLGQGSGARVKSLDFIPRAVGSLRGFLTRDMRSSDFFTKQCGKAVWRRTVLIGSQLLDLWALNLRQITYLFCAPVFQFAEWEVIMMMIIIMMHMYRVGWRRCNKLMQVQCQPRGGSQWMLILSCLSDHSSCRVREWLKMGDPGGRVLRI